MSEFDPYAPPNPHAAAAPYALPYEPPKQHPRAVPALVCGVLCWTLGLFLVCSIPAWVMGARALRDIRANPHLYTGEGEAKAGYWLGMINTLFFGLLLTIGLGIGLFFRFAR